MGPHCGRCLRHAATSLLLDAGHTWGRLDPRGPLLGEGLLRQQPPTAASEPATPRVHAEGVGRGPTWGPRVGGHGCAVVLFLAGRTPWSKARRRPLPPHQGAAERPLSQAQGRACPWPCGDGAAHDVKRAVCVPRADTRVWGRVWVALLPARRTSGAWLSVGLPCYHMAGAKQSRCSINEGLRAFNVLAALAMAMRQQILGSHTPPCHRRMVITTLFSVLPCCTTA